MLIVDANILVSLIIPGSFTKLSVEKIENWKYERIDIAAPLLYQYELTSALRKAIALKVIVFDRARLGLDFIETLGVQSIYPTPELHQRAILWAEKINHLVAYDAQYLATAEEFRTEFWTGDRKLAVAASKAGADWVHWIEE